MNPKIHRKMLDLTNVDIYRCNSDTCSDNGGVCIHIVPKDYEAPTACTNPESFEDDDYADENCGCKWEQITVEDFFESFYNYYNEMPHRPSPREKQILAAMSTEWQTADEILAKIEGRKLYKCNIYSHMTRLAGSGLIELRKKEGMRPSMFRLTNGVIQK